MVMPGVDPVFATPAADVSDPGGPIDVNPGDADETTFTRTWTIEPSTPLPGMTRITVDIAWDAASGATHTIRLQGIKRL
jgi:hypothetical protein